MTNPAEIYESYMVPALFGPWADRLVAAASLRPGERVLDVGCGTGIVARRAAARVGPAGKVVGLDLNPNMLAVARAAAAQAGLPIEWREGRAEQMPMLEGSFDVALCQFALMFFEDKGAALAEMRRVAAGGRVCLSVFQGLERHPFYQRLDEAIQQRFEMSGVQEIFALGEAEHLRIMLAEAGFQEVSIEQATATARFPNPEAFLAGEIAVDTAAIPSMQHLDAQARQAVTAAISEDMAEALREVTEGDEVAIPFHVHLVCARA